jgi:hypothetical protein
MFLLFKVFYPFLYFSCLILDHLPFSYCLNKQRDDFQKQEFDTYLKHRLEHPGIEIFETKRMPKNHYEVYSLIEQGKSLINSGNLGEAEKVVSEVQTYYDRLKDGDSEKRRINYNLLELITDLKLASLA